MAKILHFPTDFPIEKETLKIPSLGAMVITLKRYYSDELTENQTTLVETAEQRVMRGCDTPADLRVIHQIYIKLTTRTLLERIRDFCKQIKGRK